MRRAYVYKKFSPAHALVIEQANGILAEYAAQGYTTMTLRQVYYQFVSRDLVANTQQSYKRLGSILNDARLAGLVDWARMEDRTRAPSIGGGGFDTVAEYISSIGSDYGRDTASTQPAWIEIWVEKEALIGVIDQIASRWRLSTFACRGNVSQSAMYDAGRRLTRKLAEGKEVVILHMGDHDPNGIDMSRDNEDRLRTFVDGNGGDADELVFRRIALNMDQVERYGPPPNPVKLTDSRSSGYVLEHGRESWELDALDPSTMTEIITSHVDEFFDYDDFARVEAEGEVERETLYEIAERWDEIAAFLQESR